MVSLPPPIILVRVRHWAQGYLKDTCFKLHGYLDWYVELLKTKKDKRNVKQVNLAEAVLESEKHMDVKQQEWMTDIIKQESSQSGKDNTVNFIQTSTDFAGITSYSHYAGINGWIIDTGASNHICINSDLLEELHVLPSPISIHLPNGNIAEVTHTGNLTYNGLKFTNILHLPNFSHNLLSVNQLTLTNHIFCSFSPSFCTLSDQMSKKIFAVGRVVGNLYCISQESFHTNTLASFNCSIVSENVVKNSFTHHKVSFPYSCAVLSNTDMVLWHLRMGHPSDYVFTTATFFNWHKTL